MGEEKQATKNAIQKANDHAIQYTQTFNIVNHKPNIKASKLKKKSEESQPKKRVPGTRAAYNIISNKGFSTHHHLPPDQRPVDPVEPAVKTTSAPGSQKADFNIINNRYEQGHEDKEALDKLASKQLAADRFWKTHNFNAVEGKFYDDKKEGKYQNMLKEREQVQGEAQQATQPRSIKYSEGAMYDLISNATKDETKLHEVSAIGNRALKSKKRHQIEANTRQRALNNDQLASQRTQNRMSAAKMNNSGFNPITNAASPMRGGGGGGGGGSAWDRLTSAR